MTNTLKDHCYVSKFDPTLRDNVGRYLRDDWTSYSDIGSEFKYGGVLTRQEYLSIEDKYIIAVKLFFKHYKCSRFWVTQIDRLSDKEQFVANQDQALYPYYDQLYEGLEMTVSDSSPIVQLLLRGYCRCVMAGVEARISILITDNIELYFYARGIEKMSSEFSDLGLYVQYLP